MANKQYIERLKLAVEHLHSCSAVYLRSVPVKEVFQGKVIWEGQVEVFDLSGHPKAKRAYGWSHPEGDGNKGERFVAVLEIPPVDSPGMAVKISIARDVKAARK